MAKTPEFVCTGLHLPRVHYWARVLVTPERLQRVKHGILTMGHVCLKPGERLEIDTCPGDDIERALSAGDPDTKAPLGACLVAWNGTEDITVYADDADHVAAISEPVTMALVTRQPHELITKEVWLHSDRINSIRVGGVQVSFDRSEDRAKKGPADEEEAEQNEYEGGTLGRLERAKATVAELARYAAEPLGYQAHVLRTALLHTIEDAIVQVQQDDRFASEAAAFAKRPAA